MEITLVNFSTTVADMNYRDMSAFRRRQIRSANRFGLHKISSWSRKRLLQTSFYHKHSAILDSRRGAGYWLWKPFIILQELYAANNGDFVFYLDCDIMFLANPQILISCCDENNGFFVVDMNESERKNTKWTKRDCFYYMGLDTEKYHLGFQVPAEIQIYRRNPATITFCEEYLHHATDARILTDQDNTCGLPNFSDFIEHRHDQSILSLLKLKYDICGFRWPSQRGNHLKLPEYRHHGEWLEKPYSERPMQNSPYDTILADQTLLKRAYVYRFLNKYFKLQRFKSGLYRRLSRYCPNTASRLIGEMNND